MKTLIACEESQAVTSVFRRLGHEAYSCDIIPCSGGHPEWHIQGDVLNILYPRDNGYGIKDGINFTTVDGTFHTIGSKWDMVIAFPPCTDLAVSGARWFKEKQADGRQQRSIEFFMKFVECHQRTGVPVAIENPVGIMSSHYRKPDQIIQPWQYGHGETKATCLWLHGLPKLEPTNIVDGREQRIWRLPPSEDRAKLRSKTFSGIAEAMGNFWGGVVE